MVDHNDNRDYDEKQEQNVSSSYRYKILNLIEIFIEQIFHMKRSQSLLMSLRS
jgi:hypothetical protein